MVPVINSNFRPYYNQKVVYVMRKIFMLFFMVLGLGAHAANAGVSRQYLADAGKAWAAALSGVGSNSSEIARQLSQYHNSDLVRFNELIGIIAYNDTALAIYEATKHLDMAYSVISRPMAARRTTCANNLSNCAVRRRTLSAEIELFASTADFDSDANGDFTIDDTGLSIRAKGYAADGFAFGVGYTHSSADTRDNPVYNDAKGNSVTLFAQYLAESGLFLNIAAVGGHISWETDKTIAAIRDDGVYDTDFWSGQIVTGIQLSRGPLFFAPRMDVRYAHLKSDAHTDGAAQSFDRWRYDVLTAGLDLEMGANFAVNGFVVRPNITIGGGYDIISHADDNITVQVIGNQRYDIPVERPARAALRGGLGIGVYGASFAITLDYKLDSRSDYMAHTGMLNAKIAF